MKRNRIIVAVLAAVLTLSGCACENSKDKKDETVVQKKKEKKESKQDAVNQPEEDETKPVVDTGISSLYTDEELLAYANDHFEDYWRTYYGFMAGTYFEGSGDWGQNLVINDSSIHSLQDVEGVWYQKFSRRYPAPYMDMNINFYKEEPFWEENGRVYERNHIDGIVGHSIYFDHIVQKSDDEVWFALFSTGADGAIHDWNQEWSFVYEDGQLKYGTVVRHDQ